MKFIRLIEMFLLSCIVSMFIFPIEFTFLPAGLNTKMILGVVGIIAYIFRSISLKETRLRKTTIISFVFAVIFSVWCFFSMVANGTPDDTYATYFISFAVWLGGAYAVCAFIKGLHGKLNLQLLVQYLVFVCFAQCILALVIDNNIAFKNLVDTYIRQGQNYLNQTGRLYGIGASLDTAGSRFSVILTLLAHLISTDKTVTDKKGQLFIALLLFFFITLIGNMMARTTIIGSAFGLVYMFIRLGTARKGILSARKIRFYGVFLFILLAAVIVSIWKYNTDPAFRSNLRFAFEGFFNLFENGEFRTSSTDKLNAVMWIWPTDVRGWIIGTGWFGHFIYSTDIGYCRFVLYCGLVGLALFSAFFIYDASVVWRKFRNFKFMAFLLVAITFILWIKVATDIFWIYALLFCLPDDNESAPEAVIEE